MAGNYADVPGHRMAYDMDGTAVFNVDNTGGTTTQLSGANVQTMNDEDNDTYTVTTSNTFNRSLVFIFPELRDIVGINMHYFRNDLAPTITRATSTDTTNGLDGTWSSDVAWSPSNDGGSSGQVNITQMRTGITSTSHTAVKAIRIKAVQGSSGARSFIPAFVHIYGAPSASSDRLEFWHPTLDQTLGAAALDWGDTYQGQTITPRQFRVKNLSGTLTANTVSITREAPTDGGTLTTLAAHTLSDDDVTYTTSLSVSSLAPGAISNIMYVKYAPTTSSTLGLRWARLKAAAASWT